MKSQAGSGLDGRRYRAVVTALTREMFRAGIDASSGARTNPLVQVLFSMLFMGSLFSVNLVHRDSVAFVHLMFAAVTLLAALAVIPETLDARERRREVLLPHPVSTRTLQAARMTHLAVVATFLGLSFSAPGLVALRWLRGVTWLQLVGLGLALVAANFSATAIWHALSMLSAARLGTDRQRRVGQGLMILATLGVMALPAGQLLDAIDVPDLPEQARLWLPSSWFAALIVGPRHPLGVLGAAAIMGSAIAVLLRFDTDAAYEQSAGAGDASQEASLTFGILKGLRRALGPRILPERTFAVAGIVMIASSREEPARVRAFASRFLVWAAFGVALFFDIGPMGIYLVASLGVFAAVGRLSLVFESTNAAASWLFGAAPIPASCIVAGLHWTVLLMEGLVPAGLIFILLVERLGVASAGLMGASFPVMLYAVGSLTLLINPRIPLGDESRMASSMKSLLIIQLAIIPILVVFALLVEVAARLGLLGAGAVVLTLLALGLLGRAASHFAARRFGRLECAV